MADERGCVFCGERIGRLYTSVHSIGVGLANSGKGDVMCMMRGLLSFLDLCEESGGAFVDVEHCRRTWVAEKGIEGVSPRALVSHN